MDSIRCIFKKNYKIFQAFRQKNLANYFYKHSDNNSEQPFIAINYIAPFNLYF